MLDEAKAKRNADPLLSRFLHVLLYLCVSFFHSDADEHRRGETNFLFSPLSRRLMCMYTFMHAAGLLNSSGPREKGISFLQCRKLVVNPF